MGSMSVGIQDIHTITVIREEGKISEAIIRDRDGYRICSNVKVIDQ